MKRMENSIDEMSPTPPTPDDDKIYIHLWYDTDVHQFMSSTAVRPITKKEYYIIATFLNRQASLRCKITVYPHEPGIIATYHEKEYGKWALKMVEEKLRRHRTKGDTQS